MRNRFFFFASALAILALPLVAQIQPYSAVSAPEWDALFDRKSGWTGADGVRSIPRSGDERPGTAGNTTTFWVFGDTFIGNVDQNNHRQDGTVLVNNTVALLNGGNPDPAQMQFFWGTNSSGAPAPPTTASPASLHGVAIGVEQLDFFPAESANSSFDF